ncbi:MAG: electron transfer flavoprotein beta subunit/FixA family protein [Actinomycetaceae bacterium]|nr:electron transfer flavoprotein beta subunit/FixA family protein [Actinomycetaceae bacterium]
MTVVVAYKYAANPQDASVGADGQVDWSRAKSTVSEYDPVAIQLGRNVADAAGTELVGVSVGGKDVASSMAKKNAMSKGLDRALVVADDDAKTWNLTKVASALAGLVGGIDGADILLAGDSSIDEGAKMVPALVAGFLGWPCFQSVVAVAKTDSGYEITQNVPGGRRTVAVDGPVVVAASSDAVSPKVPSMKDILASGKKPFETAEAAPVEAGVTVTGRAKPETKTRKNKILTGDSAAADLVAALRADGVL